VSERLVWIDCEMTGLEVDTDVLIEVAAVVTDSELNPVDDGIDVVISVPDDALAGMIDVVREMHAASGLTDAVKASTTTLPDAERRILDYIRSHVPEARRAPLCGNSIATDRAFLARYMPELDAYLHYRMVDVSSVKELVRRWYPRVYFAAPQKCGGHRALADIRESIDELRYYRAAVFVEAPGPDTAQAQRIASLVVPGAESSGGAEGDPQGEVAGDAGTLGHEAAR
jgi:oligoribonuclease